MRSLVDGAGHLPNGRQIRRAVVDNSDAHRAGPPRQALLHHRRHRVPGHGPRRAHPALRPRGRDHGPGPARAPGRRHRPPGPRGHQERLLRPAARGAGRRLRGRGGPAGPRRCRRRRPATGSASTTKAGAALAEADVVIHSAATVSFDAPLTQAVEINLLGPSRVAAAMADVRLGGRTSDRGVDRLRGQHAPGRGQGGAAQREPLHARRPVARTRSPSARRLRDDLQAESRKPEKLRELHQEGPLGDRRGRRPPDRGAGREASARSG